MFKFVEKLCGLGFPKIRIGALAALIVGSGLFASCDFIKGLSGGYTAYTEDIEYLIHEKGTGDLPKEDMMVKLHFKMYKQSEGKEDSLLSQSYTNPQNPKGLPLGVPVKGAPGIDDVLKNFRVGDSVTVRVPFSKFTPPGQPLPPGVVASDKVKLTFKIVAFATQEEYKREMQSLQEEAQKEMMAKIQASKLKDEEVIKAYLEKNQLKAERSPDGLYYIIEKQGTGAQPVSGEQVTVHYEGRLLADGSKFDASYDRGEPFKTIIGQGMVIEGWDKGIPLLKVGGKGTLIIPSSMAYGEMERPGIPANSILTFKVELLKTEKAPEVATSGAGGVNGQ